MINIKSLKKRSNNTAFVGVRVSPEEKQRLESICETEGVSVSTLIAELIREFLKNYKGE